MRKGFGLLQALLIIVLVSGILVIAMRYATVSIKQTSDLYVKEAASVFMDSAVELSLLAISGYDRNLRNNCLENIYITSSDKRFSANVNVAKYYLYKGFDNNDTNLTNCDVVVPIKSEDTHGMVMLEVVIETNAAHPKNGDKSIRLMRRTLQRP